MLKKEEAAKKHSKRVRRTTRTRVTGQELKGKYFLKERGERGATDQIDTIEESGEWKLQRTCMKLSKLEATGGLGKAV